MKITLKPLSNLFEQCFNAGKTDPLARPNLSEWAEVFEQLAHMLVKCQNNECNASFNFLVSDGHLECPFCGSSMNNSQVLYIRNNLQDL
jgi:DNA-binding helix-hairpin-helix protein with protein kinase domain